MVSFAHAALHLCVWLRSAGSTYGQIAVWSTPGCPGSATFQPVRFAAASNVVSDCTAISSSLAYPVIGVSIFNGWILSQYSSMSECLARSSNEFITQTQQVDSSCYNFYGGSFSLYLPGQAGVPSSGDTTSYPPMHTSVYTGAASTPMAGYIPRALWLMDSHCKSGSGELRTWQAGACISTETFPGASNTVSYRLSCDTYTTSSTWTMAWYSASTSCAGTSSTISGTGVTCVAAPVLGGSVYVDCSGGSMNHIINWLPTMDGGWSPWGSCSTACEQTRTCTHPAPSGGGAICVGASSQACNTQACGQSQQTILKRVHAMLRGSMHTAHQ